VNQTILFTAAHAHFPDTEPLGGGKTVADFLIGRRPEWRVLSPRATGVELAKSVAEFSELEYARFCRRFEQVTTDKILQHDPADCVVLTNDISEGPDFARLGRLGYRMVSLWHVDVVDYFCRMYLRGWIRPERAAGWSRYRWLPDMLKLVFHKQAECVRHCSRLVVPSAPMKEVILQCYPDCSPEKIVVLPWGNLTATPVAAPYQGDVSDDEVVIMTLSRLSPEKGIERLLQVLPEVPGKYRVWICGAPAFMQGRRYAAKLRRLAGDHVEFLGHVTGERKVALLQRADIFVSVSRHESYGLTIAEAAATGCQIVSHRHYGASGIVVDFDQPREVAEVLRKLIQHGRVVKTTVTQTPNETAERLTEILQSSAIQRTVENS